MFVLPTEVIQEVDVYLNDMSTTLNALKFWKEREQSLPILAKHAREQLVTVATSANAKRAFFVGTTIECRQRFKISVEKSEDYVMLQSGYGSGVVQFQ